MRKDRRCWVFASGLLVATGLTGCEGYLLEPVPASLLEATVEGNVASTYQGNAVFSTLQRGTTGFLLRSDGLHRTGEGFQFRGKTRPEAGIYMLAVDGEIQGRYSARKGNLVKQFEAVTGELVVTSSSSDRLEGSFHFTGRLMWECDVSRANVVSCTAVSGPDQPMVDVAGSIEAVAARGRVPG